MCSICTVIPRCAPSATSSITVHHQPFNKITHLSIFNFLLYINYIFFKIYFCHLLHYSNTCNKQTFLHVIKILSFICTCMYIAIVCELHICKEGQPYKRMKSQLTYHCSFIRQWILACCVLHLHCHPLVCSVCMLIHHSPPSAFKENYISIFIILIQYNLHVHDY